MKAREHPPPPELGRRSARNALQSGSLKHPAASYPATRAKSNRPIDVFGLVRVERALPAEAPNRMELWAFEPGAAPKLLRKLNCGIP
jgi:hypothetical protein